MSRSLGQLTLDLVANIGGFTGPLDKAQREADKRAKEFAQTQRGNERAINGILAAMDKQVLALGKTAKEQKLLELQTRGATKAQLEQAKASLEAVESFERKQRAMASAKVGFAAIAAATVAAVAGLSLMVNEQRRLIDESSKLAQSIGGTVAGMDALARAGGRAGVQTAEMQAAVQRLNQALGAAQMSGGPAAATLDRLGLSARELSRMDVDARIAAISNRMRDMGLTTQQAAVELRNLGIRQSSMIVLMQGGGDAIEESRRKLEAYGVALTDIDAAKVEAMNDAFDELSIIQSGIAKQITVNLAPVLKALADLFLENAESAGHMGDRVASAMDTVIDSLAFAINAVDGFGRAFTIVTSTAAIGIASLVKPIADVNLAITELIARIPGVGESVAWLSESHAAMSSAAAAVIEENRAKLDRALNTPLKGDAFKQFVANARSGAEEAAQAAVAARGAFNSLADSADDYGSAAQDAVEKQISAIERAAAVWGMTATEVKLYELRVAGATEAQLEYAGSVLRSVEALEEQAKAQKEAEKRAVDSQKAYEGLVRSLRTEEERRTDQLRERLAVIDAMDQVSLEDKQQVFGRVVKTSFDFGPEKPKEQGFDAEREALQTWYDDQLKMLEQFRAERADLNTQWDAQEEAIRADHEARLTDINVRAEEYRREQLAEGFSSLLEVASKYYEGMEGEQAAYTRAALQLGQLLLDDKKRASVQSIIASTHAAAMGAYESLSSVPYIGPTLGAAAAAGIYVVGGAASAAVVGMAHDGIDKVPQTGTWLLEKGERVTTAETSAKLDATLDRVAQGKSGGGNVVVNLFEDRDKAGQVDQREDPNDQSRIIDVFVSNIQSDGRAAQAIQGKWGLAPRGR